MFKKSLAVLLVALLIIFNVGNGVIIKAEDKDDYEKCMEDKDVEACSLISSSISKKIKEIESKIKDAESDQQAALELASEYSAKAQQYQDEIDDLKAKIDDLKQQIADLEAKIKDNEEKIQALNSRVKNRMVTSQKTMHFNGYLNFILGSQSFSDLLRRVYGVQAINDKDKQDRQSYLGIITQLNNDKEAMETNKKTLDETYDEVVAKQAELIIMQQYYEEKAAQIQEQLDDLTAQRDEQFEDFNDLRDIFKAAGVVSSDGFVAAVHNSWISEGVWNYSPDFQDGKWHLGVDYAASRGTDVHAPAGGIIIRADDSCRDPGYLGNYCGAWISGGGNQIYMLAQVDDEVYGFIFFHLHSISVAKGDVVLQDEVIGTVGSSGSSTGPHSHIEMYYLGSGDIEDILAMNWNSTFSVGRGATAYSNRCYYDDGSYRQGAPCILNPQWYLPEN